MAISNLYDVLVEYHSKKNLNRCKPHIKEGLVTTSRYKEGVPEGREVDLYDGHTFVCNGAKRLETLIKDGYTTPSQIGGWVSVKTKDDLFNFLDENSGRDGAVVFDRDNSRITMVYKMIEDPKGRPVTQLKHALADFGKSLVGKTYQEDDNNLAGYVPATFVHKDSTRTPSPAEYGTNSRLAHSLSKRYPGATVYQIKKSAFGSLGMGKVVQWDSGYVAREFYIDKDPSKDHFIGIEHVYEQTSNGQGPRLKETRHINLTDRVNSGLSHQDSSDTKEGMGVRQDVRARHTLPLSYALSTRIA